MIIGISTRTRPQESRGKDRNSLIHKGTRPARVQGRPAAILGIGGVLSYSPCAATAESQTARLSSRLPQESSPAGIQFQWFG
jgi:hypothetical protein